MLIWQNASVSYYKITEPLPELGIVFIESQLLVMIHFHVLILPKLFASLNTDGSQWLNSMIKKVVEMNRVCLLAQLHKLRASQTP